MSFQCVSSVHNHHHPDKTDKQRLFTEKGDKNSIVYSLTFCQWQASGVFMGTKRTSINWCYLYTEREETLQGCTTKLHTCIFNDANKHIYLNKKKSSIFALSQSILILPPLELWKGKHSPFSSLESYSLLGWKGPQWSGLSDGSTSHPIKLWVENIWHFSLINVLDDQPVSKMPLIFFISALGPTTCINRRQTQIVISIHLHPASSE